MALPIYSIIPKEEYKRILNDFDDTDKPAVQTAMDAKGLIRISDVTEPLSTGETLATLRPMVYVLAKWNTGQIDYADRAVYEYGLVKLSLWATAVDGEFLGVNAYPITGSLQNALMAHGCVPVEIKLVS